MPLTVERGEVASYTLYGMRHEDGSIEIGHSGETRTVEDGWPETVTFGPDMFDFNLEYVEKQTPDGVIEYDPDEVPDTPGREWGAYM